MLAALAALFLVAGSSAIAGSGSGSSGSGSSGSGSGGTTTDFAFSANYKPPFVGYVVRGGLSACSTCTSLVDPHYRVTGFTLGWDSNSLGFTSLNGFSGTVGVQVTGLPDGVTSETATSVTVPRGGSTGTPLRVRASTSAPLGSFTITVRAFTATKTHTITLPIEVVDSLPTS